jgi:hypothetical protein
MVELGGRRRGGLVIAPGIAAQSHDVFDAARDIFSKIARSSRSVVPAQVR